MSDGSRRAAIALEGGGGKLHGWITLVMKDGAENEIFTVPQPPLEVL